MQGTFHTVQKVLQFKGLGHTGDRAEGEGLPSEAGAGLAADEDKGIGGPVPHYLPQQLQTVAGWHIEIRYGQIEPLPAQVHTSMRDAFGKGALMALIREKLGDNASRHVIIVYNQDSGHPFPFGFAAGTASGAGAAPADQAVTFLLEDAQAAMNRPAIGNS